MSYGIKGQDGSAALPAWTFANDTNTGVYRIGSDNLGVAVGGSKILDIGAAGLAVVGTLSATGATTLSGALACAGAASFSSTVTAVGDVAPNSNNTAQLGTASFRWSTAYGVNFNLSGYMEGSEIADPAAPSANSGRAYFRDNGAGKTQFVVRFPTGAVQVLATEP